MAKIRAGDVATDVRAGMFDTALMSKYKLTSEGLQFVLRKLLDAGFITPIEFYERTALSDSDLFRALDSPDDIVKCISCGQTIPHDVADCPFCADPNNELLKTLEIDQNVAFQDADISSGKSRCDLHNACAQGDYDTVKDLLRSGSDPNTPNFGNLPLIIASENGHELIVALLLDHGAKINAVDGSGRTALNIAAGKGFMNVSRILLARGAHMETNGGNGGKKAISGFSPVPNPPKESAVLHGKQPPEPKLEQNQKSSLVKTLFKASRKGDLETMGRVLRHGIDVNEKERFGNTAFLLAAYSGRIESAEFLLVNGADKRMVNDSGNSAVFLAVSGNHPNMISFLAELGCDTNTKNINGNSPLLLAVNEGKSEIVRILLKSGADPNVVNPEGDTCLMKAIDKGESDIIRLLISQGADTEIKNKFGNTALMKAALKGQVDTVRMLLDVGTEVNAVNMYGNTALMKACHKGHSDVARMLLEAGADAGAKDVNGGTAAMRTTSPEIINLLVNC